MARKELYPVTNFVLLEEALPNRILPIGMCEKTRWLARVRLVGLQILSAVRVQEGEKWLGSRVNRTRIPAGPNLEELEPCLLN